MFKIKQSGSWVEIHDTTKEDISNKTNTISSSSTEDEYPSAKAVYDYIESLDGNEDNF